LKYLNFDIWIESAQNPADPREQRKYPIRVHFFSNEKLHKAVHEDEVNGHMIIPLSEGSLKGSLERVQDGIFNVGDIWLPASSVSSTFNRSVSVLAAETPPSLELQIQQFGTTLFSSLFTTSAPVYATYYTAYKAIESTRSRRLRIRLFIKADELAALPWELMYNPYKPESGYLCLDRSISLVRCIPPDSLPLPAFHPVPSLETELPLSMFGMVALSRDERERVGARIEYELQEVTRELSKKVEIRYRRCQDWASLQEATRGQERLHVFHFLGHGGFNNETGRGFITLTDQDGNVQNDVEANDLGSLLHEQNLRLVVLNTCESARGDDTDRFSSTASTLARSGIPAVVAMQYKIKSSASLIFTRAFYDEIGTSGQIDAAVSKGRLALKERESSSLAWVTPVLYLNAENGKLFKINSLRTKVYQFRKAVKQRSRLTAIISLLLLVIFIASGVLIYQVVHRPGPCEQIGLSTGALCFNPDARDAPKKQEAAQDFTQHSYADELSALRQAIAEAPDDAEAQIYLNNLMIRNTVHHITLVVGVDFSSDFIGGSRDILQGALIAQNEWNLTPENTPLVLLIANVGEPDQPATPSEESDIVKQLTALHDQSILGIAGWETSQDTYNIDQYLNNQLPIISPSASSDALISTQSTPGLFRVVAADAAQAQLAASFAAHQLHKASTVAILNTTGNLYSGTGAQTLESDFQNDLLNDMVTLHKCSALSNCLTIPPPIPYTSNDMGSIQNAQSQAFADKAALIFFSGYAIDLQTLLASLPAGKKIPILGGDGLSIMNDYTQAPPDNVYFTAFASPVAWDGATSQPRSVTKFFSDFNRAFSLQPSETPVASDGVQGVDADTILGYDALQVLLQGYTNAISHKKDKTPVSPGELLQGIQHITTSHPYQGISGAMAFSNTADTTAPLNKWIVLEHVINGHTLKSITSQGCLLDTQC